VKLNGPSTEGLKPLSQGIGPCHLHNLLQDHLEK